MEGLTKIRFDLQGQGAAVGGETVWAEQVGPDLYRLRNIPFNAFGFAFGDIVRTVERDGWPTVMGPAQHGSHYVVRIMFAVDSENPPAQEVLRELTSVGCTFEMASRRFVAVDAPPDMDVPFQQMVNYLNSIGEDVIVGWEIAKGPEARQS